MALIVFFFGEIKRFFFNPLHGERGFEIEP